MSSNFNIILKISEACPLKCDYCYYFRNIISKHKPRPTYIQLDTIEKLCQRIMEYNNISKIDNIMFSLHGGEPLCINKKQFCSICDYIKKYLNIPFELILQSNGILIDREWIEIFKYYKIHLGISIDGPKKYQNIHRKLKNGKGSFNIVDKNIKLCLSENLYPGLLIVADPNFSPHDIFTYIIQELGIKHIDILLRDYTKDTIPSIQYVNSISIYLKKWLKLWFEYNDYSVYIRIFDSIINALLGKASNLEFGFKNCINSIPTITVYTNGDVSPADELFSIGNDFMDTNKNIYFDSFLEIFNLKIFDEINSAYEYIPLECESCYFKYVCRGGGGILERYSSKNGFKNKGAYCLAWKELFTEISKILLLNGYSREKLLNTLTGKTNEN